MADTYFTGETDEAKAQEYLGEMLEDAEQKNKVFSTLKRLKVEFTYIQIKYTTPDIKDKDANSAPSKKVKKDPKKS